MNKLAGLILLFSTCVFGQQQELYDHKLNESKWEEIRNSIRYENQPEGAGREWTYESGEEYSRARNQRGGGSGNGTGGSGDGGSRRYENYEAEPESSVDVPDVNISPSVFNGLGALGWVLLGLLAVVVAFLIYYLFVNREKDGKAVTAISLEEQAPTEIPLTELQRLLKEALSKGDYRGAVRIYFIFILRDLSQKNWIKWDREKTNFQYLREMSSRPEFQEFEKSVSYFEIIWYGKRIIDQNTFEQIKPAFTRLLDKLGVN